MPGPMDSLRFVHTAILRELGDLDDRVRSFRHPAEVGDFTERLTFLELVSDRHTRGEEIGMFPALDEKAPGTARAYLMDHEDERETFDHIRGAIARWTAGDEGAIDDVRREVWGLKEHVSRHIRKENEIILPFIADHFTAPEQGQMLTKILATITPEEQLLAVPWIVGWIDPEQRVMYVSTLQKMLPPPVMARFAASIRARLAEKDWTALVDRVPEIA